MENLKFFVPEVFRSKVIAKTSFSIKHSWKWTTTWSFSGFLW